jgi:hypothetical protein
MGWDERIARATGLLCQAALMSEPVLYVGYQATLHQVDVVAPSADGGSDARGCDEVGTSAAARSAVASRKLAWR